MTKFFIEDNTGESIEVFDTETITPGMMSEYKAMLALATHRKAAIDFLQAALAKDELSWKGELVLLQLSKIDEKEEDPSYQALMSACKAYQEDDLSPEPMLASMAGLVCYRAGIDAGAGFKQGSIDILGTEGLIDCVALAVRVLDKDGYNHYYLAHISGHRKTRSRVVEELDCILGDLSNLAGQNLTWAHLQGDVTIVGDLSADGKASLAYQHIFTVLDKHGAAPAAKFANNVAIVCNSGQIILNPAGRLVEGEQARALPVARHGRQAPLRTKDAELTDEIVSNSFNIQPFSGG